MQRPTIGELARQTRLSISAIRFYQRRGLLPAREPGTGWQRFGPESVARLIVIELAKRCGFTLDEVAALLDALYGSTVPTATWQAMGLAKVAEIDARIAQLTQMRGLLDRALAHCALDLDRTEIISMAFEWTEALRQPPEPLCG